MGGIECHSLQIHEGNSKLAKVHSEVRKFKMYIDGLLRLKRKMNFKIALVESGS